MPSYTGDFLPLEMQYMDSFWSGYYTSRPAFKKAIRDFASLAYASSTLFALDSISGTDYHMIKEENEKTIESLQYLSLLMHHDAITGTSMNKVINDYTRKLLLLNYENAELVSTLFADLLKN